MTGPAVSTIEHTELLVAGSNIAAQIELDMAYHKLVREIACNADLSALLDRIQVRSHLARNTRWRERATSRRSRDEHCEIPAAIASGDPETAEQAAHRHIAAVRTRIAGKLTTDEKRRTGA